MIITIIQVYCYSLIGDTSYYTYIIDIYRYKCDGILIYVAISECLKWIKKFKDWWIKRK